MVWLFARFGMLLLCSCAFASARQIVFTRPCILDAWHFILFWCWVVVVALDHLLVFFFLHFWFRFFFLPRQRHFSTPSPNHFAYDLFERVRDRAFGSGSAMFIIIYEIFCMKVCTLDVNLGEKSSEHGPRRRYTPNKTKTKKKFKLRTWKII